MAHRMVESMVGNLALNQIAFVVEDIDKANEVFTELLGLEKVEPFLTGDQKVSNVIYRGKPTESRVKLAFLNTPTIQFELIEPDLNPGTMRTFLDTEGEGIHHVAFDVDSINERLDVSESKGYPLLQSGNFTSSDGRYIYADTKKDFKTYIELLESKVPRDTTYVKADGKEPLLGTNKVEQIAFVVKDLDKAAEVYGQLLGIEKPKTIESAPAELTNVIYNGERTEGKSRYMFIDTPLIQIELIEPGDSPSTWSEHLEQYGEGVHHISFVVKDLESKRQLLEERGYPTIQTGNFYNGKGRYAYMDTRRTYKVIIELLERYED